jgi:hypothetical protein
MTKQQRKKLRRKLKKKGDDLPPELQGADEPLSPAGAQTSREPDMPGRTKETLDQLLAMNENEQDLQWQRPRSHSLPGLALSDDDEERPSYQFRLERDFQYEIQEYLVLRREI